MSVKFLLFIILFSKATYEVYDFKDIEVLANRLSAISAGKPNSATQVSILNSLLVLSQTMESHDKELKEKDRLAKEAISLQDRTQATENTKQTIEQFIIDKNVKARFDELRSLENQLENKKFDLEKAESELNKLKIEKAQEHVILVQNLEVCKKQRAEYEGKIKEIKNSIEKLERTCETIHMAMKNFENQFVNKNIMIAKAMELEDAKINFFQKIKEYEECDNLVEELKKSIESFKTDNTTLSQKLDELKRQSSLFSNSKEKFDKANSIAKDLEEIKTLFEKIKDLDASIANFNKSIEENADRENEVHKETKTLEKQAEMIQNEIAILEKEVQEIPKHLNNLNFKANEKSKASILMKQLCTDLEKEVNSLKTRERLFYITLNCTMIAILASSIIFFILRRFSI